MENETKNCSNCKFLRSNNTCKENPTTKNGPLDWCGAWKKSKEK